jgi:hypothetical protein
MGVTRPINIPQTLSGIATAGICSPVTQQEPMQKSMAYFSDAIDVKRENLSSYTIASILSFVMSLSSCYQASEYRYN